MGIRIGSQSNLLVTFVDYYIIYYICTFLDCKCVLPFVLIKLNSISINYERLNCQRSPLSISNPSKVNDVLIREVIQFIVERQTFTILDHDINDLVIIIE